MSSAAFSRISGTSAKPSIARVQGYALAGGLGLALACDLVVAADDAIFGTPEIDIGIWPYMVTVALLQAMTPKRALELMMTGRRVSAPRRPSGSASSTGWCRRQTSTRLSTSWPTSWPRKPPAAMRAGRDSFYTALGLPAPRRPQISAPAAHGRDSRGRGGGGTGGVRRAPAAEVGRVLRDWPQQPVGIARTCRPPGAASRRQTGSAVDIRLATPLPGSRTGWWKSGR